MTVSRLVWSQLKNKTCNGLISALERDGWVHDTGRGAIRIYRHPDGRRVSIHYHPNKTFGAKLLKSLLADIGWTEDGMRRLKLIR